MDHSSDSCVSSLLTLVNTAKGMEQDAKDDHCYAFNEEKSSFEGREKDHNYSTTCKTWFMGHRKTQSLSDENIFKSTNDEVAFLGQSASVYLPHHLSNDSALDVMGFDTISRKCILYENIDMKTIEVSSERCILPGTSDPDISRMTLGSNFELNSTSITGSVPNSPQLSDLRSTLEHNYSKGNVFERLWQYSREIKEPPARNKTVLDKSPLLDHSYNSSKDNVSFPFKHFYRRRSIEQVRKISTVPLSQAFTKSPFLDHTYQSVRNQAMNTETNVTWKKGLPHCSDRVFPKPPFLDHSYNTVIDSDHEMETFSPAFIHNRTSLSAQVSLRDDSRSDHSYVINNKEDTLLNSPSCASDSGTESLTEEDDDLPTSFGSLVSLQKDHPYFTHINWS